MMNGYNLVTNSAPVMSGSTSNDLAWICTMEAGEFSYNDLSDIPLLEGITLSGAMTYDYLGVQPSGDYATNTDLNLKLSPSNLKAGDNVGIIVSGTDVTITSFFSGSYIPYVGATTSIDLGSHNLSASNITSTLTFSTSTAHIKDLYIMNEDNVHYHQIRIRTDGLDNNFVIGAPITL